MKIKQLIPLFGKKLYRAIRSLIFFDNSTNFLFQLQKQEGRGIFEHALYTFTEQNNMIHRFICYSMIALICIFIKLDQVTCIRACIICGAIYGLLHYCLITTLNSLKIAYDNFFSLCESVVIFEISGKEQLKLLYVNNTFEKRFQAVVKDITNRLESLMQRRVNIVGEIFDLSSQELWKKYLEVKTECFLVLFRMFENLFCQNHSHFYIFLTYVGIIKKKENVVSLIYIATQCFRDSYAYLSFLGNPETQTESTPAIEAILKNVAAKHILNGFFADQLVDILINHERLSQDLLDLIGLIDKNQEFIEKMDNILEKKYASICALQQVKRTYMNRNALLDQKEENVNLIDGNTANVIPTSNNSISLLDIELHDLPILMNSNQAKKNENPVSHFDIIKGENETRQLQTNLLSDLEEYNCRMRKTDKDQ